MPILSGLSLSNPQIIESDGDGVVSPGETVAVQVSLDEVAGTGMSYYPGVVFTSDDPGVTFDNNGWLYAILPCTSMQVSSGATIAENVKSGAVIQVTAHVAMLNQECNDTYSITFPIEVK